MFGGTQFSPVAYFADAIFKDKATFSGETSFIKVQFYRKARFLKAIFSGDATFNWVKFSELATFALATFSDKAWFKGVIFSGGVSFYKVEFYGEAYFGKVQFFSVTLFQMSKFKDSSDFIACLYEDNAEFDDVTGFSNMRIEWEYNYEKFGKESDEQKVERRGLKHHLQYSETFYIALIKNFREIGWYNEADYCYYTYRVEKRKNRLNKLMEVDKDDKDDQFAIGRWWRIARLHGEYLLLDFTFGYGVKPRKVFRTFSLILRN